MFTRCIVQHLRMLARILKKIYILHILVFGNMDVFYATLLRFPSSFPPLPRLKVLDWVQCLVRLMATAFSFRPIMLVLLKLSVGKLLIVARERVKNLLVLRSLMNIPYHVQGI